LNGDLNVVALETALNQVIARHDALRLRFAPSGEVGTVMPEVMLSLPVVDLDQNGLDQLIADDAKAPFDLIAGPMVRAQLARLAPKEHVLVFTTHHIVCDGWSTYLIIEDLAAIYGALSTSGKVALPDPISFAEYAKTNAAVAPQSKSTDFWEAEFTKLPELPNLPVDQARTNIRTFEGATFSYTINADLANAVKTASAGKGVTLFAALSGALAVLLDRLSPSGEIVLAVPTAGQTLLLDDRLVGHLVNLLPIPMEVPETGSTGDFLGRVSSKILDCFDHGDTTYGDIVQSLGQRTDPMRQPLTEVQFNLDQQPADFGFTGLKTMLSGNPRAYTNFDIIFNVTESVDGLRIDLTYATDVLSEDTVARWCEHYETLLAAIPKGLETPLAQAPGQGKATDGVGELRVDQMFAAQIAADPDAIAIEDAITSLSYNEVARKSDMPVDAFENSFRRGKYRCRFTSRGCT